MTESMAAPVSREAILDRIGGSLWGLFIGDALAMPTHWFYGGEGQVHQRYGGPIQGYVQPVRDLPGSIMNLSSTGGGGRGSDSGEIVGKVINHGKKQYWTKNGQYHYHCTLASGENTLECQLVRQVMHTIASNGGEFDATKLRKSYMDFMTTPGTHNDCYVSTCHRMFFANLVSGKSPEKCPDNDGHNVDTIDGIAMTVPVALALLPSRPFAEVKQQAASCAAVTRASSQLEGYVGEFAQVLNKLLAGSGMSSALEGGDNFMRACKRKPDPVVA